MIKKADIILIVLLVIAGIACSAAILVNNHQGSTVVVSVDGSEYGRYSLSEDKTVTIHNDNHTNKITIHDGSVSMSFSDCKNQVCIDEGSISTSGQTIVCLPNKVIVEIESQEDAPYDSVTQ